MDLSCSESLVPRHHRHPGLEHAYCVPVTDRQLVVGCTSKHLAGVKDLFVIAVTKEQSSTFMECWKDSDKGAKHLLAPGSIDVRLEEQAFTWTAT
jgi:hypothetical protein